jgi:tRNA pseudouridine38-40 synthase
MNWKLTLSYDGTNFHGWQVQPGLPTVQAALAATIFAVTGERVLPQGAGRTDAGVHALGQVASFKLMATIPAANLHLAINRALPASIRVLHTEIVDDDFHARRSARGKTYEYRIHERRPDRPQAPDLAPGRELNVERRCTPFEAPYVWDCRWPLSLEAMSLAAKHLEGMHDFTSFAASDPDLRHREHVQPEHAQQVHAVKTIITSNVLRENELLLYRVTGSGFLHHMVRNIVGTLVEVGRGALQPEALPSILLARDRRCSGPTAPPQGLFLHCVHYE